MIPQIHPASSSPRTCRQIYETVLWCDRTFSEPEVWGDNDPEERFYRAHIRAASRRVAHICELIDQHIANSRRNRQRLLDIGIGYAYVTTCVALTLAEARLDLYAVEHPERRYLMAPAFQGHLAATGVKLTLVDVTAQSLPYEDASFEVVVLSEVVEHLPPSSLPFVLSELARVVCPGGLLICSSPNLVSLLRRLVFLSGKSVFDPILPLDYAPNTFAHIRLYTVQELSDLMQRYGLNLQTVCYTNDQLAYVRSRRAIPLNILQQILARMIPSLSQDFILSATKGG